MASHRQPFRASVNSKRRAAHVCAQVPQRGHQYWGLYSPCTSVNNPRAAPVSHSEISKKSVELKYRYTGHGARGGSLPVCTVVVAALCTYKVRLYKHNGTALACGGTPLDPWTGHGDRGLDGRRARVARQARGRGVGRPPVSAFEKGGHRVSYTESRTAFRRERTNHSPHTKSTHSTK